ncbi:MAG TPA: DUF3106 domain-containing protein [Candidatus Deferrimicrobiaceae bacterium]|nr:DUF3106 domain-containing protein [Candidatus Deferrimicrobiaceae bacterium]
MLRSNFITAWMAAAVLVAAALMSAPCLAQHNSFRPIQGRPAAQNHSQGRQGHAGDWLRHYQGLPPGERERALQNDPGFRRLPPERQQMLRQRLQHFSSLPPQQQQRMLNRMETWEHLTPAQKDQARQLFDRMRQLPPDRQRMVHTAIRDLRTLPPGQREQIIDSNRFRGMFSPQERDIMRGATRLPLAPAENGRPEE